MEVRRQQQLEELFHSALQLPSSERASFLQHECGSDAGLRQEIESLLAYESSASNFIEEPALQVVAKQLADDSLEEAPHPEQSGQRYRLIKKLSDGGMGVVFEAEDLRLKRTVALKFLTFELASDALSLERFQREAYAASALNHPNICTVYDAGEYDGRPCIAMDLLDGQTLEQRIGGKPLPLQEVLRFAIQIADALGAAHAQGIIHRDIKPSNIFINTRGVAKILDFGLAKLQSLDSSEAANAVGSGTETISNLTLTGVAVGTLGYMSPEQIRGEKLDARTDLFSFGLVLYEMATGRQAFTGTNGAAMQKAILEETPVPVRKLAPNFPAKLEKNISKALQKERGDRYQSAAGLRSELDVLRHDLERRRYSGKWAAALASMLVLSVAVGPWLASRNSPNPAAALHLKQRQLTNNSSENQVKAGAISPDGKYLAYSDLLGIHIKVIETGKTRTVPQPDGFRTDRVKWEAGPWLPDSSGFMAGRDTAKPSVSYWLVSASGGPPRNIRDDINPWSYTPVGSWLAATMKEDFNSLGGREIWVMKPDGRQARKVYEATDNSVLRWVTWSPDAQRLAYVRERSDSDPSKHEVSIESRDLQGESPATILSGADLRGFDSLSPGEQSLAWLPDGRLIYEKGEPRSSCPDNLFEARLNNRTGTLLAPPKQITDWAGFCIFNLSNTADGKRLTLARQSGQAPAFVAAYDPVHQRMETPSRLTLTEDRSIPVGWTRDSHTVVFVSDREGSWGLYKQSVNASTADPLVTGLPGISGSGVDVRTEKLLYAVPDSTDGLSVLMRVSLAGGTPEEIIKGHFHGFGCPLSRGTACVIGELTRDGKEIVFTSLDPMRGRGQKLASFPDDQAGSLGWQLSPDGRWVGLGREFEQRFQLLSLEDHTIRQIDIKSVGQLRTFTWSTDSKGLFASLAVQQGAQLTHIDLQGNARPLWENRGQSAFVRASAAPDGRHLAIAASRSTTNIWMIEDF